jgi:hypothetical protein
VAVIRLLKVGGRHFAAVLVEPRVVEPVDVSEAGDLDLSAGAPRAASIGMGSDCKNNAVHAGLPLSSVASPSLYLALKQGQQLAL